MIDGDEADDKIIAVLESDVAYGHLRDIADAPHGLIDRLRHYFLSYKQLPHEGPGRVEIAEVYDREGAGEVIRRSVDDYRATLWRARGAPRGVAPPADGHGVVPTVSTTRPFTAG